MANPQEQPPAPIERWRVWLGRLILLPLIAFSAGFVFVLYRAVATGQITAISRGYQSSSRVYYFSDSPISFLVVFTFAAALAGLIIFVTYLVARRAFK